MNFFRFLVIRSIVITTVLLIFYAGVIDLIILTTKFNQKKYYCTDVLYIYTLFSLSILLLQTIIVGISILNYVLQVIDTQTHFEIYNFLDIFFRITHLFLWLYGSYVSSFYRECNNSLFYTINLIILTIIPLSTITTFHWLFTQYQLRQRHLLD